MDCQLSLLLCTALLDVLAKGYYIYSPEHDSIFRDLYDKNPDLYVRYGYDKPTNVSVLLVIQHLSVVAESSTAKVSPSLPYVALNVEISEEWSDGRLNYQQSDHENLTPYIDFLLEKDEKLWQPDTIVVTTNSHSAVQSSAANGLLVLSDLNRPMRLYRNGLLRATASSLTLSIPCKTDNAFYFPFDGPFVCESTLQSRSLATEHLQYKWKKQVSVIAVASSSDDSSTERYPEYSDSHYKRASNRNGSYLESLLLAYSLPQMEFAERKMVSQSSGGEERSVLSIKFSFSRNSRLPVEFFAIPAVFVVCSWIGLSVGKSVVDGWIFLTQFPALSLLIIYSELLYHSYPIARTSVVYYFILTCLTIISIDMLNTSIILSLYRCSNCRKQRYNLEQKQDTSTRTRQMPTLVSSADNDSSANVACGLEQCKCSACCGDCWRKCFSSERCLNWTLRAAFGINTAAWLTIYYVSLFS